MVASRAESGEGKLSRVHGVKEEHFVKKTCETNLFFCVVRKHFERRTRREREEAGGEGGGGGTR